MEHSLEQVRDLHKMCIQELRELIVNCEKYMERSNEIENILNDNWENIKKKDNLNLIALEMYQENLVKILNFARKFNLHLEINSLERCSSNAIFNILRNSQSTKDETISLNEEDASEENNAIESGAHEISYENQKLIPVDEHEKSNWSDDELSNSFYFPKKDLTQYQSGSIINATITYIKNVASLQFYIWDLNSPNLLDAIKRSNIVGLRQYVDLPPENEVFGLLLDDNIVRVVLENVSEFNVFETLKRSNGTAYLLDFGETVEVCTKDIMYRLPIKEQQIPSEAILCQLIETNGISGDSNSNLKNRLDVLLHKQTKFKVITVKENIIQVIFAEEEMESNNIVKSIPKAKNTNPFLQNTLEKDDNDWENGSTKINSVFGEGLTEEELDMLFDNSPGTTNAMKAVMGYNPKDESRICPFYDHKIGWCFKGSRCQLEHTPLQPDGWTKDTLTCDAIVECPFPDVTYESGTVLKITPTYIEHLDHFYAQIVSKDKNQEPLIWNDEDVADLKQLKKLPFKFDLVLARYEDGLWYRAKVMETNEISNWVKVFYVDYGNYQNVRLKSLKQCDPSTVILPFQAILCRIANLGAVSTTQDEYFQGLNLLCNSILNKNINVEVVNHHEDLIVRFIEKDLSDLPEILIQMGCAKPLQTIVI